MISKCICDIKESASLRMYKAKNEDKNMSGISMRYK